MEKRRVDGQTSGKFKAERKNWKKKVRQSNKKHMNGKVESNFEFKFENNAKIRSKLRLKKCKPRSFKC